MLLTVLGIGVFYGMFKVGFNRLWPYNLLHHFTFPALGGLTLVIWFCIIEAGIVVTNWIGIEIVRRCVKGQVDAFGQIVGGPILGLIATVFTTQAALIASAIILSPALLLYAHTLRRDKPLAAPIEL